jgi:hypothetical protein
LLLASVGQILFKPESRDLQAPLLVSLFALVLRLIDHKSFFYDEFFSFWGLDPSS